MYRIYLALRYLRSRLVNLISVGGVMFGVAVLIAVVAIFDGFQEKVRETVRGTLSHLILTPSPREGAPPDWWLSFEDLSARLKALPHVEAAAPQATLPILFPYASNRVTYLQVRDKALFQMQGVGIDWRHEQNVSDLKDRLVSSHLENPFYDPVAAEREKVTVLVGRAFAERFLGLTPDQFQDFVDGRLQRETPEGETVAANRIVVIYAHVGEEEGGTVLKPANLDVVVKGIVDLEDYTTGAHTMYFDLATLRSLASRKEEYLEVRLRLDDYHHASAVKALIQQDLPDYAVETWEEQRRDLLAPVESEKIMLFVVLSFIVLLGGFIILATLTLTVVEKTRDIGILGALGASRRGILAVFLWNGLLIGVLGAGLGVALGAWFVANVDLVRELVLRLTGRDIFPPDIYHFRTVPTVWHWPTALSIMGGSVVMAFLAGLVPAIRAARLDPVAALRYE